MPAVDIVSAMDFGRYVADYGYVMIVAFVFLDNFGLPASGDVALILGATMAAEGELHLPVVVLLALVAALASDSTMYWLSRNGLRGIWVRLLKGRGIDYIENYFEHHGAETLIVARPVAAFRTKAAIIAGMSALPYRRFAPMNLLGTILWLAIMTPLGYFGGVRASHWLGHFANALEFVIAALVVVFVAWLVVRWRRRRRQSDLH
jgi:membrane protein DedA with SNARE-associated domain